MKTQYIGERILLEEHDDRMYIVIKALTEKWKQQLLLFWLVCWTFCGIYFAFQLFLEHPVEFKLTLGAMLSFWVYFELKIGRVYLWRRFGKELIYLDEEKFTIKNDILSYGIAKRYHVENMGGFTQLAISKRNFWQQMQDSFWVIAGDRLAFSYQRGWVKFGKELSAVDSAELQKRIEQKWRALVQSKS